MSTKRKKVVDRKYRNRESVNVNFVAGTVSMRSVCFCDATLECGHVVTLRGGRTFKTATCPTCKAEQTREMVTPGVAQCFD